MKIRVNFVLQKKKVNLKEIVRKKWIQNDEREEQHACPIYCRN